MAGAAGASGFGNAGAAVGAATFGGGANALWSLASDEEAADDGAGGGVTGAAVTCSGAGAGGAAAVGVAAGAAGCGVAAIGWVPTVGALGGEDRTHHTSAPDTSATAVPATPATTGSKNRFRKERPQKGHWASSG